MGEIRDKTIDEIAEAMANAYFSLWENLSEDDRNNWRYFVKNKILSNEHIAIVDRKAQLPNWYKLRGLFCRPEAITQTDADKAGFVKEIKDDT